MRLLVAAALAAALVACGGGGPDVIENPQYAGTYDNPGGQAWEQSYSEDALREGATEEQLACALAFIKDNTPYTGDETADAFWIPPFEVMVDAGEACG